ncbi:hypothetical protein QR680_005709 [Steinernema hermaphroditum]|uniref:Uncharacterized protein n=1 Tax=Steinernema hermaphroditum TaxID=289476 RepID=A0AA39HVC0_9BILA|nr:hypothetical protein QR680_005709 [Steinernema hermaphroditum]
MASLRNVFVASALYFWTVFGCQPPTNTRTLTMTSTMAPSSSKPDEKPQHENSHDEAVHVAKNFVSYFNENCKTVKISVITKEPYSDDTVRLNAERLKQEVVLLEAFTQVKLSSFGEYKSEPLKFNKFFANEFVFVNAANECAALKDFTTKAVSFSPTIEKAYFSCGCEAPVEISKVRSTSSF